MGVPLHSYINQYKPQIKEVLVQFFDKQIYSSESLSPNNSLTEMLRLLKVTTCEEGKMVRPLISLSTYQALSNKEPEEDVLKAVASLELIHKFLLIHDDIADNDRIRYDKQNLFGIYEEKALNDFSKNNSIAERYGLAVSMIAGDLNHDYVYKLLNETNFDKEKTSKLINEINRIIQITSLGWKVEYDNTFKTLDLVTEEEVLKNLMFITPTYTIDGTAKFGAILADKDTPEILSIIEKFTLPLGTAYQITDDLHGTFNKTSGQDIKSDIKEGKKTLHAVYAYKQTNEKEFLVNNYGKKDISDKDFEHIKEIFISTGAKEYAEEYSEKLLSECLEGLKQFPAENKYKDVLRDFANFAIKRTS